MDFCDKIAEETLVSLKKSEGYRTCVAKFRSKSIHHILIGFVFKIFLRVGSKHSGSNQVTMPPFKGSSKNVRLGYSDYPTLFSRWQCPAPYTQTKKNNIWNREVAENLYWKVLKTDDNDNFIYTVKLMRAKLPVNAVYLRYMPFTHKNR